MDDFPLQIVDIPLTLGNAQFYSHFHFRVPGRISLDKGLTVTRLIERICNAYNLKLLCRADYDQLQIRIDSGLYANALEQDPVLPWEILQTVFSSVTELESLLFIRNTCKSTLLFFDTHVDDIWQNVCQNCVPYRVITEQPPPIHTLTSFKNHYYRIYYTRSIDRFINLEDALQFHLIHGNLDLFVFLTNKLTVQQIAGLAIPYLQDGQVKQFAEHFSNSCLFYALYYCCAYGGRLPCEGLPPRCNGHLTYIQCPLQHEEQKVYYKASVFLEYEFTREQLALLLACALQKTHKLLTCKLLAKLKQKGLVSRNEFYQLIRTHGLTKSFDCQELDASYAKLCGPLLPVESKQDYVLITAGLAVVSAVAIYYYRQR